MNNVHKKSNIMWLYCTSAVPVVVPPRNQYVASNSMDVLNYSCTVDNENKAIWEVRGIQYSSQSQLTQQSSSSGIGLMIVPMDLNSRVSMISISNVTRGNLSLQCVAIPSQFGSRADKGVEYFVVSFGKSKVHVHVCVFVGWWYCYISCGTYLPPTPN